MVTKLPKNMMYMYIKKTLFLLVILTGLIIGFCGTSFNTSEQINTRQKSPLYEEGVNNPELLPKVAAGENAQIIEDIFSAKLSEYSTNGFFNQIYEPSLQATYYALYILKALDKLESINQTAMVDYIMAYYNTTTHIFTDDYAYRYMDTDPNIAYYPFTTLLEVNCYAILSLALLDQLPSQDIQRDIINFTLSCYHPDIHGFIGQPYNTTLPSILKIPTMDNTYYAIITLEALNENLGTKRQDTLKYIKDLQIENEPPMIEDDGFKNDDDDDFRSLGSTMLDPNLLSAYYCIKSLALYDYADSIVTDAFHEYLTTLYDDQNFIFQLGFIHLTDKDNIVASALGLQISDLTPLLDKPFLDSGNRSGVINFILNNRNSMGNWDSSTIYEFHELFNTFLIIRSLNETGAISQLTEADKNEIFDSLSYYNNSEGYCLLSSDYASVEQYYNVINSFNLYEREGELDQSQYGIIDILEKTCLYEPNFSTYYFYACTNIPVQEFVQGEPAISGCGFHSYPIEYFTMGNREYLKKWNRVDGHKTKYQVLDSLDKIGMLSNLDGKYDLNAMLDNVVNSQFLETGYSNKGGFLPTLTLSSLEYPYSYQNSEVTLEHSYYAVKCMEFLTEYLNLGPITDLAFYATYLHNYIIKDIVNSANYCYYDPHYTDSIETILENTFYMIYVLKAIDMYNEDDQKIKDYVLQNINYSNIKNIYYSYKISEILGLDISFDVESTYNLVQEIYSEELHEFYLTTDRKTIEQQAFPWICEMATNDKVRISSHYSDTVMLGDYNTITASLCNMILKDFGPYTVKYESSQLGNFVLDPLLDSTFEKDVYIPVEKDNYPQIDGFIRVYEGITQKVQLPISFQTNYSLVKEYFVSNHSSGVYSEVNVSLISASDNYPLHDSVVYAEIYKNELLFESKNFSAEHLGVLGYSLFTLNYSTGNTGEYIFRIFLDNPYETSPEFIGETLFSITFTSESGGKDETSGGGEEKEATLNANYQSAIPLMIAIIVIPSCVIGISTKLKRKTLVNSRTK